MSDPSNIPRPLIIKLNTPNLYGPIFFIILEVNENSWSNKYKIGHTIPNTKPGGFNGDLFKFWYQISSAVFEDARPPINSAIITNIKTENLEEKIKVYLFLKNLRIELEISLVKVEPLGLASI